MFDCIVWCLLSFPTFFSYICSFIHAFLEFLLVVFYTIFCPTYPLLSHLMFVRTVLSSQRGMISVVETVISPRRKTFQFMDRTSDLMFSSHVRYRLRSGENRLRSDGSLQVVLLPNEA